MRVDGEFSPRREVAWGLPSLHAIARLGEGQGEGDRVNRSLFVLRQGEHNQRASFA